MNISKTELGATPVSRAVRQRAHAAAPHEFMPWLLRAAGLVGISLPVPQRGVVAKVANRHERPHYTDLALCPLMGAVDDRAPPDP